MKVRVKKTGEVLNVAEYAKVATDHCNDWGNPIEYSLDEIEIIPDEPQEAETPAVDWEQRRYEIAKEMFPLTYLKKEGTMNDKADLAIAIADALIERLKK